MKNLFFILHLILVFSGLSFAIWITGSLLDALPLIFLSLIYLFIAYKRGFSWFALPSFVFSYIGLALLLGLFDIRFKWALLWIGWMISIAGGIYLAAFPQLRRPKYLKMIVICTIAAAMPLLIWLFLFMFAFSSNNLCRNEVLAETYSPDGKFKAIAFQRDCGATTGFSTQVSILKSPSTLGNEAGNVFISDTNHGAAPSGPGGGSEVRLEWRTPSVLKISHHQKARVFKAEQKFGFISIEYEPFTQ